MAYFESPVWTPTHYSRSNPYEDERPSDDYYCDECGAMAHPGLSCRTAAGASASDEADCDHQDYEQWVREQEDEAEAHLQYLLDHRICSRCESPRTYNSTGEHDAVGSYRCEECGQITVTEF